jgi:hypothetical protein
MQECRRLLGSQNSCLRSDWRMLDDVNRERAVRRRLGPRGGEPRTNHNIISYEGRSYYGLDG